MSNIDYKKLLDAWGEKVLAKSDEMVKKEETVEVGSPKWQQCRSYGDGLRMALTMLNRMEKVEEGKLAAQRNVPKYVLSITPTSVERKLIIDNKIYVEKYEVIEENEEKDLILTNDKMKDQVPDSFKELDNFYTDILSCEDISSLYYISAAMDELNEHLTELKQK